MREKQFRLQEMSNLSEEELPREATAGAPSMIYGTAECT